MSKTQLKYWALAARPKTLPAALIPVVTATALAFSEDVGSWLPAVLCMLFALCMQIAANFINDLFDFLKGSDREDRLGPERAVARGWISPYAMKWGIAVSLIVACAFGCGLLCFAGPELIFIGAACVVFAFLYTTLLSYIGGGDLLVWLFFGFVPVCGTYYVQAGRLSPSAWWLAAACGLVVDTLLVLNNYRDRSQDALSGKRTLIVVLGEEFGSYFYLFQGVAAFLCLCVVGSYDHVWTAVLPILYMAFHLRTWREMVRIHEGRELNRILGQTSRNMLIFALLVAAALCIDNCQFPMQ